MVFKSELCRGNRREKRWIGGQKCNEKESSDGEPFDSEVPKVGGETPTPPPTTPFSICYPRQQFVSRKIIWRRVRDTQCLCILPVCVSMMVRDKGFCGVKKIEYYVVL